MGDAAVRDRARLAVRACWGIYARALTDAWSGHDPVGNAALADVQRGKLATLSFVLAARYRAPVTVPAPPLQQQESLF